MLNNIIFKKIKKASTKPGVYIFYQNQKPLYIGKATNLKSRLKSYLQIKDLKTKQLHQEADKIKLISLSSPIEALIQEARLIKELKPSLNVYWRDDKNYFYVAFTKEKFPKIFITHQPKLDIRNSKLEIDSIGPFTDGQALRLVLKILRRHLFFCTCFQSHCRHCLNAQIGLCLGYCCQKTHSHDDRQIRQYKNNIKTIQDVLSGQNKNILKKIVRPEDSWVAEHILKHADFLDSKIKKIECYDISNFAGKEAVGAFTVLVNKDSRWWPDRNQFRKFKIRYTGNTRNDPAMMAEILQRRLNHPEWPYPDLIIVDGGLTQYNAAQKVVKKIPLISFAKPNKKVYGQTTLPKEIIEKAINQTHYYVINYHRQLRGKMMLWQPLLD